MCFFFSRFYYYQWNQFMVKGETRNTNQWTTSSTKSEPQTTIRPIKRTGWTPITSSVNNEEAAPARQRSKSWDKSYAKSQSYKTSWSNNQPLRESFVETEWDDDVPIRHVFRDTVDDKEKAAKSVKDTWTEREQYERPSRQSFKDEWSDKQEVIGPEKETHINNKPARRGFATSWDSRNPQTKPERIVDDDNNNNDDDWEKPSKLMDEKWDKLARDYFDDDDDDRILDHPDYRDPWDKNKGDFVSPAKPKFNVKWEDSIKPENSSAKFTDKKTEDNNKNTGRVSNQQFGWRSSINHSTTSTSINPTAKQRATTNAFFNTEPTQRPTIIPKTERPKTERPRTERPRTERPRTEWPRTERPRTEKPKSERPKAPKESINILSENLSSKKKQHRIGTWITSDRLTDRNQDDDWPDAPLSRLREEEYDDESVEQLPERVEVLPPTSGRQREEIDHDDPKNWRIEDSIPGVPGNDYPVYATVPQTSFNCKNHEWPGYYADVDTQCQVCHALFI